MVKKRNRRVYGSGHNVGLDRWLKHAEKSRQLERTAYPLMIYKCSSCLHMEIIWNSRDAVTPFFVECSRCDELKMSHTAWEQDSSVGVEYVPDDNTRVFVDMTLERADQHLEEFVERSGQQEFFASEEGKIALGKLRKAILNDEAPDIISGEEYNRRKK